MVEEIQNFLSINKQPGEMLRSPYFECAGIRDWQLVCCPVNWHLLACGSRSQFLNFCSMQAGEANADADKGKYVSLWLTRNADAEPCTAAREFCIVDSNN